MRVHFRNLVLALVILPIPMVSLKSQVSILDLDQAHQQIRGYGGMNLPGWIEDLTPDQADKAFGNEPGQIGLSILRVRVPYDTNAFTREVPTALIATTHGAIVLASPWTPPAWMKTNNSLVAGRLNPAYYGAFADHLNRFAEVLASGAAPLYAVSLQNEPDISVEYESCDWTSAEMIDFLKAYGGDFGEVRLLVAESFNFNKAMTDPILNDASAEARVDIIGGHIYGGGLSDYPLARSKGKEVWMTEHLETTVDWNGAMSTAREIHNCMMANYNAYIWWYIRRYYGLLNESGSISKRGYVMSHFTKFIRPGSVRVEASENPVPGVDISAYTKDTNLVIVAVNSNAVSVEVGFTLQNGSVHSLSKFTTSDLKSLLNEGPVNGTGTAFSTSLDARSITTLTTDPGPGGRASNDPPVANAGPYQEFIDEDNNGSESVTLDGSASQDPDGTISNYTWSVDGSQIASGVNPTLDFSTGTYGVLLTVTDNDGATDTSWTSVSVKLGGGVHENNIWLEAECGTVGANWVISTENEASNGKYLTIQPGSNSLDSPPLSPADQIRFNISITQAGTYLLWGRTRVPSYDDDSFWVRMDEGTWAKWNNIADFVNLGVWEWDDVHHQDLSYDAMVYDLEAGEHTLTLAYREDGTDLDRLYLSNTGSIPSGMGGAAGNCEMAIEDQPGSAPPTRLLGNHPNPFSGITCIRFNLEKGTKTEMILYDLTGRKVHTLVRGFLPPGQHEFSLDGSSLDPGIYLYRLRAGSYERTMRMVVGE